MSYLVREWLINIAIASKWKAWIDLAHKTIDTPTSDVDWTDSKHMMTFLLNILFNTAALHDNYCLQRGTIPLI